MPYKYMGHGFARISTDWKELNFDRFLINRVNNIFVDIRAICIHIVYTEVVCMIKKMIQHGNSSAIIIDKPIMELLNIDVDTPLEISTDGKSLIISPVTDYHKFDRLNKSLKKINQKHKKTLQKLAK